MLGWSTNLGNKLFGPDPKLEFRKPGTGADLLAGPDIEIDSPYWRQYLTLFDSPTDLPLLLPTSLLLRTLQHSPNNLLTLVSFASNHLFASLSTPGFPRSAQQADEALNAVRVLSRIVPLLLGPQGADAQGQRLRDEVEEWLFWRREKVERKRNSVGLGSEDGAADGEKEADAAKADEGDGQFVLEDSEDEDAKPSDPLTSASTDSSKRSSAPSASQEEFLPPLAERLISALVDLLFVPGFTLPEVLRQGPDGVVTYAIWEPGIASPPPSTPAPTPSPTLLTTRLEVLRLLTLLISLPSLLTPPALFPTLPNRWRDALVSARAIRNGDKNVVLCLLCSVVNTAFAAPPSSASATSTSSPTSQPEGLTQRAARLAADAAKKTPASALTGAADEAEQARSALVGGCLQFLAGVLVEHAPAEAVDTSAPSTEGGEPSPFVGQEPTMAGGAKDKQQQPPANLFAFYLSRLHRPSDLSFLHHGLIRILTAPLSAAHATFLSSLSSLGAGAASHRARPVGATNEALVVLWRLVEGNRKFAAWVVKPEMDEAAGAGAPLGEGSGRSRLLSLLVAVEAVMGEWKGDETQLGLLRLSAFLSQTLTALTAESALSASSTSGHHALAGLLSAPLSAELVGEKLYGVVKRQCEAQGVEVDEEGEGAGVSFVEFLVITLHSLLLPSSTTAPTSAAYRSSLLPLYPSLLLSLSNLSPFIRELGGDASTRLVRIWLAFSAPTQILAEEGNPRLVFYLLETFNNVVHHNLDSNPHLIHSLLLTLKRLDLLSDFTLQTGVAEARRLRAARKARQAGIAPPSSLGAIPEGEAAERDSAPLSPSPNEGAGASEKALGKRRERTLSTSSLGGFSVADLSLSSSSPGGGTPGGEESPSLSRESLDLGAGGDERPFVGRNGFVPTEEWVRSWKDGLPLSTLLTLLHALSTSLQQPLPSTPSVHTLSTLRTLLLSPSITALLPSPTDVPAPKPRRFTPSAGSNTWLASLAYGRMYLAQLDYLRDVVPVQLFAVAQAPGARGASRPGFGAGAGVGGNGVVGGAAALVDGFSREMGREVERAGKTAVEMGGRVGGLAKGLFGRATGR
ncbi:hypothetical protein JCM6882_001256 [Rhodosporidiobolus microsporus]